MVKKAPVKKSTEEVDAELQALADENTTVKGKAFTYVGGGEDSPRTINFMGLQQFTRGKAVEVTHPDVLAKLQDHPTFVEGEISLDELDEYDATAKTDADKKRLRNKAINAAYIKKHQAE